MNTQTKEQAAFPKILCSICEKPISEATVKEAEFSSTDGEYYANGVPAGHKSQGWFEIGLGCFKKHVIK